MAGRAGSKNWPPTEAEPASVEEGLALAEPDTEAPAGRPTENEPIADEAAPSAGDVGEHEPIVEDAAPSAGDAGEHEPIVEDAAPSAGDAEAFVPCSHCGVPLVQHAAGPRAGAQHCNGCGCCFVGGVARAGHPVCARG